MFPQTIQAMTDFLNRRVKGDTTPPSGPATSQKVPQ